MAEFRVPLDGYDDTAQSNIWNTDETADSTAAQAYAARLNAHFAPLGSDFTFVSAPASGGTDAGRAVGPDGTPSSFVANSTTVGQTLSQPATANRPPSDSSGVFQNAASLILTGPLVARSDGGANPSRGVAAGGDSPASAGETAMPDIFNALGSSAGSGGVTTDTVSVASSGLVFDNTFEPSVTAAFKNDIIMAEQTLAGLWTNSVTLNFTFQGMAEGINGDLASNNWSFVDVTYAQLKSALASHEFSSYAQAAVASLPVTDPNPASGADWALPEAYARMLGLSLSTPATDDTVTLNTSYNWSYGQDVINTLEHEISEGGMGRVGGLRDQNDVWSTMDLFRYSAPGVRDYTDGRDGKTTYFSYNGAQLSSAAGLSFNNEYSGATKENTGDTADFTQQDVFGTGQPGETNTLSQTDIEVMDVLGWDPAPQSGTPSITAPATATVEVGQAGAIAGVSISESPTTSGETFTVRLVDTNGLLSATGTGVSGSGTTSLTISGSLSQVNSDLATLTDRDGKTPSDTITANASDSNGGTASPRSIAVAVNTPSSDFNGDGYSDFLYQNSSGEAYIRWYNGGGSLGNPGRSWHPISTGDFNGDGLADILWQNSTGEVVIWEMNGITVTGSGSLGNPGPSWHAIATGDFNGDGRSDILWQNSSGEVVIWEMNGTGLIGGGSLGNPGPSWHAIGSGDFNGDGRSDILWQNSTGEVVIWELNGTSVIGGGSLGNPGPSWHAIGTGDFNNDDRSDILWQNDSGEVAIWELNGTNVIGGGSLGNPGPSWHAIGTGDYNGDGFSDIRFQNSSGDVAEWFLNGTNVTSTSTAANPVVWHLEGDSSPYFAASADLPWQSDRQDIFLQNDTEKPTSGRQTGLN